MTMLPDDVAALVAGLRARVVARVLEISDDRALADRVADFVADAARGRLEGADDPVDWDALENFGVELAVHELRARRPPVDVVPALSHLVARADASAAIDGEALLAALAEASDRDRALLELVHVEGWDRRDAAEFFDLSDRSLVRMLAAAQRQLRRRYRRLTDSAPVVVGVVLDAGRRLRAALGRAHTQWVETLMSWNLDPVRAGVTTAAGVSVVIVIGAVSSGGDVPLTEAATARHRPAAVEAEQSQHERPPGGSLDAGQTTGSDKSAAPQDRPLVRVERTIEERPTGTQTRYVQEVNAPVPPPPGESPRGDRPAFSHFTVIDCPAPEDRSLHEAVFCLAVDP